MLTVERPQDMLTKYERARLIGARALQISQGAPLMIDLKEDDLRALHYNPVEIAKREFEEGKIPISIKRAAPEEPKE